MERTILHVDLNSFYASVACALDSSLAGKPIAVGGDAATRHGIILAKNEHAKAYGVQTAETLWQARRKCPDLVIVPPDFSAYIKYSRMARDIYERFTDQIEPFGIDECWLDVTGSVPLFGSGEAIAHAIRIAVREELHVTVSVGVSFNKVLAKLASDMKKPDAVTVLAPHNFRQKIAQLPARDLLGVGRATQKVLDQYQIRTIGALAHFEPKLLAPVLKRHAFVLHAHANGLDDAPVRHKDAIVPVKSIGRGTTTARDLTDPEEVRLLMLDLAQSIGHKLRELKMRAQGISISIKNADFQSRQWQTKLSVPSQSAQFLAQEAFSLFQKSYSWDRPIRSVTVTAIRLCAENAPHQLNLFDDAQREARCNERDALMEHIRGKHGKQAVKNACLCAENSTSGSYIDSI